MSNPTKPKPYKPFSKKNKAAPLPISKKNQLSFERVPVHVFSVSIPEELYFACRRILDQDQRTVRDMVEWGMKQFLFNHDPETAKKLGIKAS